MMDSRDSPEIEVYQQLRPAVSPRTTQQRSVVESEAQSEAEDDARSGQRSQPSPNDASNLRVRRQSITEMEGDSPTHVGRCLERYVRLMPEEFMEELLDKRFDNRLSVEILRHSGALTLLLFNRCLDLSYRYSEFREIRLYPMTDKTKEDLTVQLSRRILSFIHFTWHMA